MLIYKIASGFVARDHRRHPDNTIMTGLFIAGCELEDGDFFSIPDDEGWHCVITQINRQLFRRRGLKFWSVSTGFITWPLDGLSYGLVAAWRQDLGLLGMRKMIWSKWADCKWGDEIKRRSIKKSNSINLSPVDSRLDLIAVEKIMEDLLPEIWRRD